MNPTSAESHLLVRAIRGEPVPRPPVWAMRQAGRWDPEFMKLRAGLSFYEFSENVALAAQASLLPRRFGVDAIILFYDITTLPVAMGLPFKLLPDRGPVPDHPVQTLADLGRLIPQPEPDRFEHVIQLLKLVKHELDGALPVLVFAGAPFTLASYCIGTGKDLRATRLFAQLQADTWYGLLETLGTATVQFLKALAHEGADAYQLFDSWAGDLLLTEYQIWAQPHHQAIFSAVQEIPSILFVKECPYVKPMLASGADVVSLGARHDLARLREEYPNQVFQGNVAEELLRTGTPEQVAEATRCCVAAGGGRRHIVNLSHGVDRATPVENFQAYVNAVKSN